MSRSQKTQTTHRTIESKIRYGLKIFLTIESPCVVMHMLEYSFVNRRPQISILNQRPCHDEYCSVPPPLSYGIVRGVRPTAAAHGCDDQRKVSVVQCLSGLLVGVTTTTIVVRHVREPKQMSR